MRTGKLVVIDMAAVDGVGRWQVVRQRPYGLPCDLWSVGVCLYTLLTGIQVLPLTTPRPLATPIFAAL